ncbi:MAG TPA: hypothetical protein DDW78_03340 [Treponema sp.]|nr:hypothetical protein [Treponema sp.]
MRSRPHRLLRFCGRAVIMELSGNDFFPDIFWAARDFCSADTLHHEEYTMDISSILTPLLSSSSVNGIGKAADASASDVKNVLAQAVPVLLQAASKQTSGASGKGFEQALAEHAKDDTSNIASFLKNVDVSDGAKIISHLLGSSSSATTKSISKASGVDSKTTASILAAAAPLFMSLLGQASGGQSGSQLTSLLGGLVGNTNVTSLLGSLLGGTSSSAAASSSSSGKPSASSTASVVGGLLSSLLK